MASFSHGENLVLANHVDRHETGHRQRRSDGETGSSHSSSRSKSRSHSRGDHSSHPRERDDVMSRRENHEPRSRHEGGDVSHRSHTSTSSTDRRRSSRHYENDVSGQLSDSSRVSRQRSVEHRNGTIVPSAASERREPSRRESQEHRGRVRDRDEHDSSYDTSRRNGERSFRRPHADRSPTDTGPDPRQSARKTAEHRQSQSGSNNTLRRSSSRDHGDTDSERRERRSSSVIRGEDRESHRDPHGRHRSNSQVRGQEGEPSPREHREHREYRSSSQSHRENRSEHSHDPSRVRRRPSRSEADAPEEHRERRASQSQQDFTHMRRSHSRESSDARSSRGREHDGQRVRRSSSVVRDDTENYDPRVGQGVSHTRVRSSSRHSLAKEYLESAHRAAESRHHHEGSASRSRRISDQGQHVGTPSPRRRSRTDSTHDENINEVVRQSSTSTSDTSKDALQSSRGQACRRQRRSSPRDEREALEPSEAAPVRNQRGASHRREDNHLSERVSATEPNRRQSASSSNRRRSVSPYDEQDNVAITSSCKHDVSHVSLSRRSSSSRSNHDTGFASSSSSPRRDDSQSRFSSDASPSRYGEDEGLRSRVEESRRRRKSKMTANNSLDVPGGASLRKEQSLSSSGRGDSSFEEPYAESVPVMRAVRKTHDDHGQDLRLRSKDLDDRQVYLLGRGEGSKSQRNELKLSDINVKESLVASRNTSRSSSSITKDNSDSPKTLTKTDVAEWASSTSTLRGGNVTSKASITGSISSLLTRGNKDPQPKPNQAEEPPAPTSVSERWRRLKQGILPEKDPNSSITLTGKETAAAIFTAAAARFMSSLPRVPNSIAKTMSSSDTPPPNDIPTSNSIRGNESVTSLAKTEDSLASKAKSELSPLSHAKTKSEISVVSHTRSNKSNSSAHTKADPVSSMHSVASLNIPKDTLTSQRPSVISTTLSSHDKRANVYAVMTEPRESPDTEESGEMTPPPLDTDMKRRSKEVDTELTSFLPAEMSRREEKFHDAARVNDSAAVRTLLKEKVNVNCRNSLDRTALHWAAANGNLDAAEALIEGGADLEAKDKYGMRAVLWAAWFGHISVLKALVNAGASTRVTNKQGLGMLHCAAENNHVSVISFIFEALEPHDVNQRDKNDRTPLHSAAEGGHVEAVERLLEAKADLHKKDKGGMTAVHLAAKLGHIDVLKKLLLQGVEVDDRDVDGKTALHLAAEAGHKEAVDLLLDYTANPNSETIKEVTPLHLAAQEGHVEVCRSLVKYGCNVNAQNFQGNSALHITANGNHKEVARVLVDAKCELDLPNSRMQTPLHVAVESGHLDVVQILLAGGASLDTREKSGKSALQLAARGNYVAVVDMLIKAERYYANTREYHDKDVGYVDPDSYLRKPQHPHAPQMKDVLWKLSTKQLKASDWKKLAYHWHFTPEHVRAIEQEYTGTTSYKEHSYRLLNIWLHGVRKDENVLKLLFEALAAIDRKQLAESVRRRVNLQSEKPCSPSLCLVS